MPIKFQPGGLLREEWTAIDRTLSENVDAVVLFEHLDRLKREGIKREKHPLFLVKKDLENRIQDCEGVLRAARNPQTRQQLPGLSFLVPGAQVEIKRLQQELEALDQNHHVGLTLKKFAIFDAWRAAEGKLHINTPKNAPPYGAVIDYYRAAASVFYAKRPHPGSVKRLVRAFKEAHFYLTTRFGGEGCLTIDPAKVELRDANGNLITDR